jgi:protease-4
MGGINPATDRILQAAIESGYGRFVNLVAQSRKLTPQRVDEIGQGRVWVGGIAHQLKLVDRFGGLDDAVAEAARRAKLDPARVHPLFLEREPSPWMQFLAGLTSDDQPEDDWADQPAGEDIYARIAGERRALVAQALGDARRLALGGSVQARCLECMGMGPAVDRTEDRSLLELVMRRFGL